MLQQQAARIAASVCTAFPELIGVLGETALLTLFTQAISRAHRLGIEPDAGIVVYAAALALFGTQLDEPSGPVWAAGVFKHPQLAPERLVALLRLRLLLDTDRLV